MYNTSKLTWNVDDEHRYQEPDISGAEFAGWFQGLDNKDNFAGNADWVENKKGVISVAKRQELGHASGFR